MYGVEGDSNRTSRAPIALIGNGTPLRDGEVLPTSQQVSDKAPPGVRARTARIQAQEKGTEGGPDHHDRKRNKAARCSAFRTALTSGLMMSSLVAKASNISI